MTREHTFELEFVTTDALDEKEVKAVIRKYLNDLRETEAFIDASVKEKNPSMNEAEERRLESMLSNLSEDEIEQAIESAEELQDGEDNT